MQDPNAEAKKQSKSKRSKDDLKQRPKKQKTSSKPKYISEYISESQSNKSENIQPNSLLRVEQAVTANEDTQVELTKKEKLKNEKIRIQKEKYFREQLWEEHCYTPKVPWLAEESTVKNETMEEITNVKAVTPTSPKKKQIESVAVNKSPVKIKPPQPNADCHVKTDQSAQEIQLSKFKQRSKTMDTEILGRIFTEGIDREDIDFLKKAFNLVEDSLNIHKSNNQTLIAG